MTDPNVIIEVLRRHGVEDCHLALIVEDESFARNVGKIIRNSGNRKLNRRWACGICGSMFLSEEDAKECEKKPIRRGLFNVGDRYTTADGTLIVVVTSKFVVFHRGHRYHYKVDWYKDGKKLYSGLNFLGEKLESRVNWKKGAWTREENPES